MCRASSCIGRARSEPSAPRLRSSARPYDCGALKSGSNWPQTSTFNYSGTDEGCDERTMITRFGLLTLVLTLAMGGAAHAQMRVGWQTGDVNTEFTFAVETKKFEGEGLRLELKPFPAGPAMLPALAAGGIGGAWR